MWLRVWSFETVNPNSGVRGGFRNLSSQQHDSWHVTCTDRQCERQIVAAVVCVLVLRLLVLAHLDSKRSSRGSRGL